MDLERTTILTAKPRSMRVLAMWKPDLPVAPNSKIKSVLIMKIIIVGSIKHQEPAVEASLLGSCWLATCQT